MTFESDFSRLWNEHRDFSFTPEPEEQLCPYAAAFEQWATQQLGQVVNAPNLVAINQLKVLVLDKYFEFRAVVPKAHRSHMGRGHVCIFTIFERAYSRLRVAELALTPPMLFIPPPPPQPEPPAQIAGIVLGEDEDEQ